MGSLLFENVKAAQAQRCGCAVLFVNSITNNSAMRGPYSKSQRVPLLQLPPPADFAFLPHSSPP